MRIHVTDELLYKYVPVADRELLHEVPDDVKPDFVPSDRFRKKMKRLIRKSRHPKLHYQFMRTGGRAAVIVILIFAATAALTVSVKAIKQFRIRISDRIWHQGYVEERYSVSRESGETMKQLTYVPEGYELKSDEKKENTWAQHYENQDGKRIVLMESYIDDGTAVNRDSEFQNVEYKIVRECDVMIGEKEEGEISCFWMEGDIYYTLLSEDVSKQEMVKMIENMQE